MRIASLRVWGPIGIVLVATFAGSAAATLDPCAKLDGVIPEDAPEPDCDGAGAAPEFGDGGGEGGGSEPADEESYCPAPGDPCEVPPVENEMWRKANQANRTAETLAPTAPPEDADEPQGPAEQPDVPPQEDPVDPGPSPEAPEDPEPVVVVLPTIPLAVAPLPNLLGAEAAREWEPLPDEEPASLTSKGPILEPAPALSWAPREPDATGTVVALTLGALLYSFVIFYNRIAKERLLESPARNRILAELELHPGLTCAAVARSLGVHHTTALHHMRLMEKFGHVVGHRTPSGVAYFLPGGLQFPSTRAETVVLRRPSNQVLFEAARRYESFRTREIASALGIPRSTASDRLQALIRAGLLERSKEGYRVTTHAREARPMTPLRLPTPSDLYSPASFPA